MRTRAVASEYWPDQTDSADPMATAIKSLPKYTVSNSLTEAEATWRGDRPGTAHLVAGDVVTRVQELKDEPGDELQIRGSGRWLETLLQYEMVDRFRLVVFPLVLGSGRPPRAAGARVCSSRVRRRDRVGLVGAG